MIFNAVAEVQIEQKVSPKGYPYQVVRITFDSGKSIVLHADAQDIVSLIYAMNNM